MERLDDGAQEERLAGTCGAGEEYVLSSKNTSEARSLIRRELGIGLYLWGSIGNGVDKGWLIG